MAEKSKVVLDTNILVAAGFNSRSHSAQLVERIRTGDLEMAWDSPTKEECQMILQRIPPLDWGDFESLFRHEARIHLKRNSRREEWLRAIDDPADRKFAALARSTGSYLISNDEHLLSARGRLPVPVMTPTEFIQELAP